jgi:hypothetical protein
MTPSVADDGDTSPADGGGENERPCCAASAFCSSLSKPLRVCWKGPASVPWSRSWTVICEPRRIWSRSCADLPSSYWQMPWPQMLVEMKGLKSTWMLAFWPMPSPTTENFR